MLGPAVSTMQYVMYLLNSAGGKGGIFTSAWLQVPLCYLMTCDFPVYSSEAKLLLTAMHC